MNINQRTVFLAAEVETENVDTQATADRYTIPVACMMHQRKLPMTATVDAALINGEDHA